ncbi:MAG: hypothetical protein LUH42_01970 [Oscillospiraceae bacterium]|nr:hypothetical protein [Oscillospiraceae bacterium]
MADSRRSAGTHRASAYEESARRDRVRGSPPRDGPTHRSRETPARREDAAPRTKASGSGSSRRSRKEPLNAERKRILEWVQTVKFKRVLFGGVREQDVWAKFEELDRLYDTALRAERARYDALLEAAKEEGHELP